MTTIFDKISASKPTLRLCEVVKRQNQPCGFHLSRSQWDPYPWISNVDDESPAAQAGLTVGDFVIEVNDEDILGLRIDEVAEKVRLRKNDVRLLVWKAQVPETEIQFSAVFNFQKFSHFLQSTLQLIECPVCLESASPPTFQCVNGHILCVNCIYKTNRCPICRVPLSGRGRCLVVEKLYNLLRNILRLDAAETCFLDDDEKYKLLNRLKISSNPSS